MSFSVYYLSGLTDLIPDCSFRGISQPENIALTPPNRKQTPFKKFRDNRRFFCLGQDAVPWTILYLSVHDRISQLRLLTPLARSNGKAKWEQG